MGFSNWISRLTEIKCETCGRRMKELDRPTTKSSRTGMEFTEITVKQFMHGERRAFQCGWCARVWCVDCALDQYRRLHCVCGRKLQMNQIAVRYLSE